MAILKAAEAIRVRMDGLVRGHGLTFQHYNVLRVLRGARPSGLAPAELAARTVERLADPDELLAELERRGWVGREEDGRWNATARAIEVLGGLDGSVTEADRGAVRGLAQEELERMVALLERVRTQA